MDMGLNMEVVMTMNWVLFVAGVMAIVSPPVTVCWLSLRNKK